MCERIASRLASYYFPSYSTASTLKARLIEGFGRTLLLLLPLLLLILGFIATAAAVAAATYSYY